MSKKIFLKNIFSSFFSQIVIVFIGFLIPKLMISSYGSDINGLISTIGQIFTYLALLEAGIGQASKNALLRVIPYNDKNEINYIISASHKYYNQITKIYAVVVGVLSILLPFVIKTEVSFVTVFLIILLEGASNVISFSYSQTKSIYLMADGKGYINNYVNVINKLAVYICKIVLALCGISIVFLEASMLVFSIIKALFYSKYFKKKYKWYSYDKTADCNILKDRNAYILGEITWTLFSSTDLVVLSILVSTKMSSVYSVYNMVFANLNVLMNLVFLSTNYVLGQKYNSDSTDYTQYHDIFHSIFLGGMTILMSVCYVMILPFVSLYTHGVTDINYLYSELPLLFCLVQLLSYTRYVPGNLIGISGNAGKLNKLNITEACLNLSLSILLALRFGIVGVVFATVVALPIKVVYCLYFCDKKILKRKMDKTIVITLSNYSLFFATVILSNKLKLQIDSFSNFVLYGVLITLVISLIGILINIAANPSLFLEIKEKLQK